MRDRKTGFKWEICRLSSEPVRESWFAVEVDFLQPSGLDQ